MKIEFLDATAGGKYPKASPGYLVRISAFTDEEKQTLIDGIELIVLEELGILRLHQLSFVDAGNCHVNLVLSKHDEGLIKSDSTDEFNCILSATSYRKMIEIINNVKVGYNWLTAGEYLDEPAFLISKFGTW